MALEAHGKQLSQAATGPSPSKTAGASATQPEDTPADMQQDGPTTLQPVVVQEPASGAAADAVADAEMHGGQSPAVTATVEPDHASTGIANGRVGSSLFEAIPAEASPMEVVASAQQPPATLPAAQPGVLLADASPAINGTGAEHAETVAQVRASDLSPLAEEAHEEQPGKEQPAMAVEAADEQAKDAHRDKRHKKEKKHKKKSKKEKRSRHSDSDD